MKSYNTIENEETSELVEKKSKFIANIIHINNQKKPKQNQEKYEKNIMMQDIIAMHIEYQTVIIT